MKFSFLLCWAMFSLAAVLPAFSYTSGGTLVPTQFVSEEESSNATLTVPETGLYTIRATSSEPSSIALVDRMAGQIAQTSATQNSMTKVFSARLDVLLTRGEYRIRTQKTKKDKLYLEQKAVDVVNATSGLFDVPELKTNQSLTLKLEDQKAYGFWVRVQDGEQIVRLNAMGRSLRRCVLWKDGFWDEAAAFLSSDREFVKGRPLRQIELNQRLAPGNYLLTIFGGPPKDWALDTDEDALFVSRDAPTLGVMGSQTLTLDASGTVSVLVASGAQTAQVLTPQAVKASIQSASAVEGASRFGSSRFQSIEERKPDRLISISLFSGGPQWVTIVGPPGGAYTLNVLPATSSGYGGSVWTSSLGTSERGALVQWAGDLESADGLPRSWVAVADAGNKAERSIALDRALPLSPQNPIRAAFNNQREASLVVRVLQKGSYAVLVKDASNADAAFSFMLLDDDFNGSGTQPTRVNSGSSVDLEAKHYVVSLTPTKLNRLDFVLVSSGFDQGFRASALFGQPPATQSLIQNEIVGASPRVPLTAVAGIRSTQEAIVVRPFPLDLSSGPLVLNLAPGQSLTLPFATKSEASLSWEGASGGVSIDGLVASPGARLSSGEHTLTATNATASPATVRFHQTPISKFRLSEIPTDSLVPVGYQTLKLGASSFDDWDRGETKRYLVRVDEAGLYRLETTGRLSFSLVVRSYLNRSLSSAQTNVSGENAQVLAYLKPGYYMLEATTVNRTTGRAGISFSFQDRVDGSVLVDSSVVRSWVPAQSILSLPIRIDRTGSYKLTQLGLDQSFRYRLEDQDGWPIGSIVHTSSQTVVLDKGNYRLTSFSINASSRRVYAIAGTNAALESAPNSSNLVLNVPVERTWKETTPRKDDEFTIEVASNLSVRVVVDSTMKYEVRSPSGKTLVKADGGSFVPVELEPGKNRILVRSAQIDNGLEYKITVESLDLQEGQSVVLDANAAIPVSIGRESTYEFWTFGPFDGELSLWKLLADGQGQKIAVGQTIANDWNQKIVAALKPGRYYLARGKIGANEVSFGIEPPNPGEDVEEGGDAYVEEDGGEESYGEGEGEAYDDERSSDEEESGSHVDDEGENASYVPLRFSPYLGSVDAATVLQFFARSEKRLEKAAVGKAELSLAFSGDIRTLEFETSTAAVYRISSDSGDALNVALNRGDATLVRSSGTIDVPLPARTKYSLQFWFDDPSPRTTQLSIRPLGETAIALTASSSTVLPKTPIVRVADPLRLSRVVRGAETVASVSVAFEVPLRPYTGFPLRTDGEAFWIAAPERAEPIEIRPLEWSGDAGATLELQTPQVARVKVAEGLVTLATSSNNGQTVGISSVVWGAGDEGANWAKTAVTATQTWTAFRSGDYRVRVWDAESSAVASARSVPFALRSFPIGAPTKLDSGRPTSAIVGASSATTIELEGKKALRFVLERGMVAFVGKGRSDGILVAETSVVSGVLVGEIFTIVNTRSQDSMFKAEVVSTAQRVSVTSSEGVETLSNEPQTLEFDLNFAGAETKTWISGSYESAYLYEDETGKVVGPQTRSSSVGSVGWFEGKRGRLVVRSAIGAIKIWGAATSKETKVFTPASWGERTKLTVEGSKLAAGPQSFSFAVARTGYVAFSIDSPGFLGVFKADGTLIQGTIDARKRTLLTRLAAGDYTVYARPLQASVQSGVLGISILEPIEVARSGEAEPTLIAEGDSHLYRFVLAKATTVACGVRAQSDGLSVALFDANFALVDRGALFFRTLEPGTYSMLVSSPGSVQKYRAVFFGIEGHRTDVPQDVKNSYLKDREE